MPILDDVEAFIVNNVPEVAGYGIQKSYKSNSPDRQIVIYETLGDLPPETTMDVDYPSFQVQIRGQKFDYPATRTVAFAIYRALQTTSLVDLDVSPPSYYVYCYATQSGLMHIGNDQNERPEFVLNYRTMRTIAVVTSNLKVLLKADGTVFTTADGRVLVRSA